ncbi:MAG TPA: tRNA preQ1(34) S-adenosylmethionine ribosyltransferase-isomerase QueA [Candidatus Saccharibacteria bacterium]|nr:tRNA preQ1(34) S-adenosylmethionine ribosyltransferase-isomerase QueA [Candidatus Saccharibacteria bacterium]
MQLSDFHYNIPQELIASQPPAERGEARLLALDRATGKIADRTYGDIVDYLQSGDVLVINDTKVIKARLITHKSNGGGVRELVLVEKHGPADDWHRHRVIYRRRLKAGDELKIGNNTINVEEILSDGIAVVRAERDLLAIAEEHGSVPLPPYMQREATATDSERYQTVFAREAGSVAAPTASLNMTEATLQKLRQKGVKIAYATLHVGLGTFLPIRVEDVTLHKMHQEYYEIPSETVRSLRESQVRGNRIVALGTTITRTLEYAHDDIFEGDIRDLCGEADIFIYPGYRFKTIQGLITNFHMPESTVLMLTAAFAGWDKLRPAYEHAVAKRYNFFSYGDSMVIL